MKDTGFGVFATVMDPDNTMIMTICGIVCLVLGLRVWGGIGLAKLKLQQMREEREEGGVPGQSDRSFFWDYVLSVSVFGAGLAIIATTIVLTLSN